MGAERTLATLIASSSEHGHQQDDALQAVAAEVGAIAERAARSMSLDDASAHDVAQKVSAKLVEILVRRESVTNPDSYVWSMASNAARDLHRKTTRDRAGKDKLLAHDQVLGEPPMDPEAYWMEKERQAEMGAMLRAALHEAPDNYRRALEEHHLKGRPVEELADENYLALVDAGEVDENDDNSVAKARKKARNRADQHIKRGRDWLRKYLSEHMEAKS